MTTKAAPAKIKPQSEDAYESMMTAVQKSFEKLVRHVYFALPPEITCFIMSWYAKANSPSTQPWSVSNRIRSKTAQMLFEIHKAAASASHPENKETTVLRNNGLRLEGICELVGASASQAIYQSTIWQMDCALGDALQGPSIFRVGPWGRHIRHLALNVHVPVRAPGDCYPMDLYILENDVSKAKKSLPCLAIILVEVTVPTLRDGEPPGRLRARGWRRGRDHRILTSMEAELEKLVQEMRKSGVPALTLWYHEAGSEKSVEEGDFTSKEAALIAHNAIKSHKVVKL